MNLASRNRKLAMTLGGQWEPQGQKANADAPAPYLDKSVVNLGKGVEKGLPGFTRAVQKADKIGEGERISIRIYSKEGTKVPVQKKTKTSCATTATETDPVQDPV